MKVKCLGLLSLLFILSACSSDSDLEKVTLMLDYTPNTNHTGIYVAEELGYYEDEGIDLEIIQPTDVATESAVATGAAQFGISYGENVAMFDNGEDSLESIYAILNTNTSGFLSKKEKNITRPRDFEGKTYCGWGSAIESSLIETLVEQDGGDPSQVNIMTTSAASGIYIPDECDFIWSYEGWDKVNFDLNGIPVNYIPFTDYGVDWYTPVIITSNEYIESNPETVQGFISATQKGYQYAAKYPVESANMFADLTSDTDTDRELIEASQEFVSQYYQTGDQPFGYQDPEVWSDFTDWLVDKQIIDQQDSTKFYTNQFIEE